MIFKHRFATVAKTRRFNGSNFQTATQLVDHQCGQRFAFNIFSDDQQWFGSLHSFFQAKAALAEGLKVFSSCNSTSAIFQFNLTFFPHWSQSKVTNNHGRTACLQPLQVLNPKIFASSTVITPSLPTLAMAWAIMSPISGFAISRDRTDLLECLWCLETGVSG